MYSVLKECIHTHNKYPRGEFPFYSSFIVYKLNYKDCQHSSFSGTLSELSVEQYSPAVTGLLVVLMAPLVQR